VIVVGSMSGMLEKIKDSNGLLDKINKGLNAYLEKKRLFFPRYSYVLPQGCLCSPTVKPTTDEAFLCLIFVLMMDSWLVLDFFC